MSGPMNVLFGAAEVSPLAKVGGLADVAGSLPAALRRLGHDVRVVMPGYTVIDRSKCPTRHVIDFSLPFMGRTETINVAETVRHGVPIYLLENQRFFARKSVYGEQDDLDRFMFFSLAVPELPDALGWRPNIIHCHDWHAAGAISQIKTARRSQFDSSATVITIHNLAFQGWFDDVYANRNGLQGWLPAPGNPLRQYLYSMLGSAIFHSDYISTVSQTYAKEILTPEYGEKLDNLLRYKKERLVGIVNGLDYEEFDPATDRYLPAKYDASNPSAKAANKAALQKKFNLEVSPDTPVIGMVGRMTEQKGIDIATEALAELLKTERVQVVVLGTGQPKYEELMRQMAANYPSQVATVIGFDAPLGQLIYGGADMFLMPSRFEPCGLGQLISFRYGTVPIVRMTGGLNDTVTDVDPHLGSGSGFVFEPYQSHALLAAIRRSTAAFHGNKKEWQALVQRDMRLDFSWGASAAKYETMYQQALDYVARTR